MFISAASIYRNIRKNGETIRSPIDCIIAAICIEHEVNILHNDKDYNVIAGYTPLKIAN
jgi:predicted nucleic acid-binding protein